MRRASLVAITLAASTVPAAGFDQGPAPQPGASNHAPGGISHQDNWDEQQAGSGSGKMTFFTMSSEEAFVTHQDGAGQSRGHGNQIEVVFWSWGPTQAGNSAKAPTGVGAAQSVTVGGAQSRARPGVPQGGWVLDQSSASRSAKRTPPTVTLTRGMNRSVEARRGTAIGQAIANFATDGNETRSRASGRSETASGPQARGSLTFQATGSGRCVVGTRYPNLTFAIPERVYALSGVTVAGCSTAAAGELPPLETFSINYQQIKVARPAPGTITR